MLMPLSSFPRKQKSKYLKGFWISALRRNDDFLFSGRFSAARQGLPEAYLLFLYAATTKR
jgi:hypothetical protein